MAYSNMTPGRNRTQATLHGDERSQHRAFLPPHWSNVDIVSPYSLEYFVSVHSLSEQVSEQMSSLTDKTLQCVNVLFYKYTSQVKNVNDFWEWVNQTLVPGLYNGAWYNGNTGQPGFLNDKMSFVVGMTRIRQLRVKSGMHSDSMLLNTHHTQVI